MNHKGIASFLVLSFILIVLACWFGARGGLLVVQNPNLFQYLFLVVLMGIPALGALVANLVFSDELPAFPAIWPIPVRPAIAVTVAAPVLFGLSYLIATIAGLTYPQWGLGGLLNRVTDQLSAPLTHGVASAAPAITLVAYPIISTLVGATLFAFIALGSELGWRGYLFTRLLPLGPNKASVLTGICWGLWFVPLVYVWSREVEATGLPTVMVHGLALAIVLSVLLGNLIRRTRHVGIAALCLGAFAGQDSGIWSHLFEQASPPWTGTTGWINIAVWGVAAVALGRIRKPV